MLFQHQVDVLRKGAVIRFGTFPKLLQQNGYQTSMYYDEYRKVKQMIGKEGVYTLSPYIFSFE